MKYFFLLLLLISTTSCNLSLSHKPQSVKEQVPVGTILTLTQSLTIPADRLFIYLADGKVAKLKNYNTVDIYEPYCMFHLEKESSQPRQIVPDQFEITKIIEWERDYARLNFGRVTKVKQGADGMISMGGGNDGGPSIVMYATILSLRSSKQPEVKEMVCGHWDDQYKIEPLTLDELKTALGDLIIINTQKKKLSNKARARFI